MENQIKGVSLEDVEVQGRNVPAIVVRDSRKKQFFGALVCLAFSLATVAMYRDAENAEWPIIGQSPMATRIFAVLGGIFFLIGAIVFFLRLLKKQEYIAVTSDTVVFTHPKSPVIIPWSSVEKVGLFDSGGTPAIGMRVSNPETIASFEPHRKRVNSTRSYSGWDWTASVNLFDIKPTILEALLHYYLHHPQARSTISPQTDLNFLSTYVNAVSAQKPPIPEVSQLSSDHEDFERQFFDPAENPELFDEELQRAIEAVSSDDNATNRQRVYKALLQATFCLPASAEDGDERTVSAAQTESGEIALVAFSDPPALRRWAPEAESLLVMQAPQLFELAIENNFAEILINPAGPAGGKLTRHEFTRLAQGELPE